VQPQEAVVTEPNYAVIRVSPGIPPDTCPPDLDGGWVDLSRLPRGCTRFSSSSVVCEPTGRLEYRADGAVAEVWEVRVGA
jgi:hypothetical protein